MPAPLVVLVGQGGAEGPRDVSDLVGELVPTSVNLNERVR